MLPFISIPFLDAAPIPPKKLKGTDITSAHGHDITRNIHALFIHEAQFPPTIIGGRIARMTAAITTIGV